MNLYIGNHENVSQIACFFQQQSWLQVASAVAHSAAAETNYQPAEDDTKPTKYHYYPYNQHLYLLPECATQQVRTIKNTKN